MEKKLIGIRLGEFERRLLDDYTTRRGIKQTEFISQLLRDHDRRMAHELTTDERLKHIESAINDLVVMLEDKE
jgi:hypothetical protein